MRTTQGATFSWRWWRIGAFQCWDIGTLLARPRTDLLSTLGYKDRLMPLFLTPRLLACVLATTRSSTVSDTCSTQSKERMTVGVQQPSMLLFPSLFTLGTIARGAAAYQVASSQMIDESLGVDDFGRLRCLVASFAPAGGINVDHVCVGCGSGVVQRSITPTHSEQHTVAVLSSM